ncbi:7-methylguanosine phosphate-specific 5'-nucleotidase A isoform X3 [Arabidopsis lyrata subsp. lyrata]|uniref:7-methylguanosine phosphate-specific 5'-nucleotidase A isoform X3 n=1 Tax=Arabidopsis lyrata subsp. lyrata TaxID=81972 RepID=UPI000A29DB78|nr:7-methylguanosine phosphate-specific 5'-nucleotidase A isoform X3 [Arabidopsis lyrata subsp. lyrata]|eukprot:XP_020885845.1 7-methylguanosine phosphate-specific 5'-nucleotidase A isoform X3 [Arabidopsis lyrata subsp. lyrata]
MLITSCCTRFHAPSSICISVVSLPLRHCPYKVFPFFSQNCSLAKNQMEQPVIAHPRALTDKITLIRDAGPSKFQVIADFDATLTKYRVSGLRGQTSHGLLQQGNAYYDAKRQALYDHYHPLEISPVIPIDEKTKLMEVVYSSLLINRIWWSKTHELLIEGGLTYEAIKKSVANSSIAFREGVTELFEFLEKKEIPVLIFSAGLADVIEEVLRQNLGRTFKNVKIVSNWMVFNDDGQLVSFKGKLIHVLNKNEHALDMAAPLHDRLGVDIGEEDEENVNMKERRNVLLMGDHLGDLRMSDGLDYETRISIGFLNDNIEKSLESYRESFDLVYVNDAPMWGALELVSRLFSTEAR